MSTGFNLKSTQAQWVLGLIPSDDLPAIAGQALADGIESKSLIELAGLGRSEMQEARNLFERSLNELGCKSMEKAEALGRYAKIVSTLILASEVAPLEGAKRIWQATRKAGLNGFHDLDGFIYAASELEERPEDKALFEKAIIEEAKSWSSFEYK
jgi:hypothetical protein